MEITAQDTSSSDLNCSHKENMSTINESASNNNLTSLVSAKRRVVTDTAEGNAQREVRRLKAQMIDKDKLVLQLDKQLHLLRGQLKDLQGQEQKHKNVSREAKRVLSAHETSVRAKSVDLARINEQLHRVTQMEENRVTRKTLQLKELAAEFEQMEESYEGQITALQDELHEVKSTLQDHEIESEQHITTMESEIQRLQSSAENCNILEEKVSSFKSEQEKMSTLLEGSHKHIDLLSRELERNKCLQKLQLLAVQQKYKTLCNAASSAKGEARAAHALAYQVKVDRETSENKYESMVLEFSALQDEKLNDSLRIHALTSNVKQLSISEDNLKSEIVTLRDQLKSVLESIDETKTQNVSTVCSLQDQLNAYKNKITEISADYENRLELSETMSQQLATRCNDYQLQLKMSNDAYATENSLCESMRLQIQATDRLHQKAVLEMEHKIDELLMQIHCERKTSHDLVTSIREANMKAQVDFIDQLKQEQIESASRLNLLVHEINKERESFSNLESLYANTCDKLSSVEKINEDAMNVAMRNQEMLESKLNDLTAKYGILECLEQATLERLKSENCKTEDLQLKFEQANSDNQDTILGLNNKIYDLQQALKATEDTHEKENTTYREVVTELKATFTRDLIDKNEQIKKFEIQIEELTNFKQKVEQSIDNPTLLKESVQKLQFEYNQLKTQLETERAQGAKAISSMKNLYEGLLFQWRDLNEKHRLSEIALADAMIDVSNCAEINKLFDKLKKENSELKTKLTTKKVKSEVKAPVFSSPRYEGRWVRRDDDEVEKLNSQMKIIQAEKDALQASLSSLKNDDVKNATNSSEMEVIYNMLF